MTVREFLEVFYEPAFQKVRIMKWNANKKQMEKYYEDDGERILNSRVADCIIDTVDCIRKGSEYIVINIE